MKIVSCITTMFLFANFCIGQSITVLQHINVIDGTGKALKPDQNMIIKDGIISGITTANAPVPKDAVVIDLTGKYVMPQIINAHGHLGILKDTTMSAANYTAENIKHQLLRYQQYGVGAIVSMGTEQPAILTLKDSSRSGQVPGATIYSAIYGFGVKDGLPPGNRGMSNVYRPETAGQATRQVDSLAKLNPDLIKIWVDDFLGQYPKMKPEIYTAIIKEGHAKGLRIAAHLYYLEDARKLVGLGLDIIAHSIRDAEVNDEFISAMKKNNVVYIPTLSLDEFAYIYEQDPDWIDEPFFRAALEPNVYEMITSQAYKDKVKKDPKTPHEIAALKIALNNLAKLYKAGIMIALGTDSGALPIRVQGFSEHMELELLVKAGLTPLEAITIATLNGAKLLKISDQSGTLEPGKKADLIVLDKNPLVNIRNTWTINSVWKDGKKVSNGPLAAIN